MYAEVIEEGLVRVGDPVEPLSPSSSEPMSADGPSRATRSPAT